MLNKLSLWLNYAKKGYLILYLVKKYNKLFGGLKNSVYICGSFYVNKMFRHK
jgi:hypothetical protein